MKRAAAEGEAPPPAKRAALAVSAPLVAAELLAHAPALCAAPPRRAWGLDRLVLDDRLGEQAARELLQEGGGGLLEPPAPGRPCANDFLTRAPVLSLPGGVGQGLAVAVGLSVGQANFAATYSRPDFSLFEHRVFALCAPGALLSGVGCEASSLAGHLKLASLVVVCCEDDRPAHGDTAKRYQAYGWSVEKVESVQALREALHRTRGAEAPTLLLAGPALQGASAAAAAAAAPSVAQGNAAAAAWLDLFKRFGEAHSQEHDELVRRFSGTLPDNWAEGLPTFAVGEKAQATRQYSAKALATLVTAVPEMVGGSADLTGSNLTNQGHLKDFQRKKNAGRYLRFGVREHGMLGTCTGLSAYGGFLPFCSTFMNFFTYGWGAIRLAAATRAHVIYVATHDSIELGEDGPTHQPIEVLAACRALPNLLTLRPADGNETMGAYRVAMQRGGPCLVALSRSGTPVLEGSGAEKVGKGAYVLSDFDPALVPAVVLAGSGTEVATCVEAASALQAIGVGVRVVSMPCWELLEEQPGQYQHELFSAPADGTPLPAGMRPLRVYAEAASTLGFHRFAEVHVGMTTFGASADGKHVRKHFGFEKAAVAGKVMEALKERGRVLSYRVGRFGFCRFSPQVCAAMAE